MIQLKLYRSLTLPIKKKSRLRETLNLIFIFIFFWRGTKIFLVGLFNFLTEFHFNEALISNSGEKVPESKKARVYICPLLSTKNKIFSPGLENNNTLKCISDNFPNMLTYMLFLKKCWNYISMYRCSPI